VSLGAAGAGDPTWSPEGPASTRDTSLSPYERKARSHPRRRGFPSRDPTLNLRYVAFRIFCEFLKTPGSAECVLALGTFDGEALLPLFREVDDHVADRIEHLSFVRHSSKVAELRDFPPVGVAEISHPCTGFSTAAARRKVRNVDQVVGGGPWDRAGVDRETWYAVRMMAVAIRETARLPMDPSGDSDGLPADHERLGEFADRLVSAVEAGDPETVAMLLRRQSRNSS
jgi:hypothetical protein